MANILSLQRMANTQTVLGAYSTLSYDCKTRKDQSWLSWRCLQAPPVVLA